MTEQTATIILSMLAMGRLSLNAAKVLYDAAGSALAVLENRKDIKSVVPDATDNVVSILSGNLTIYQQRAEEEEQWCERSGVKIITIGSACYPERLRHCVDAPLTLYVRGGADLNTLHTIDIVGTRHCTAYGMDVIEGMVKDLAALCPDVTINSGLAYGVDITAHRASLQNDIPTIGIVAHGQDTLYPALHRKEAEEMIAKGGAIVTEYPRGTRPEARNFLQRNRIIAGMSDATVVIESASHGGGLVTARIAQDYGREVFAVPGPVNSEYSKGCNNLIRDNKAQLVTSAQDIVNAMNWQNAVKLQRARKQGISRNLFINLTDDEQKVADYLAQHGDSHANDISVNTGIQMNNLNATLFSLEMQGIIKAMSGNTFHLVK